MATTTTASRRGGASSPARAWGSRAYQGMLGLSYQPDDPVEIFLGYRFFAAENLGLSSGPDEGSEDAEGYSAHSGLIGFRYNF